MSYETELRNKNRGYMKLIVWQKAMELFAKDPEEYSIHPPTPSLHYSITLPSHDA